MKDIETAGIQLVGVSNDSLEVLRRVQTKHQFTFPLLSDEGSRTIDAYGVRNKEATQGIPYPTTFVVDQKGVIRTKLAHEGYTKRHSSQDIIEAAKAIR